MSKNVKSDRKPNTKFDLHRASLALCSLGSGYHGVISYNGLTTKGEVFVSSGGLFHQVGGGQAFKNITATQMTTFIWRDIVRKYGIPKVLITNNGRCLSNFEISMPSWGIVTTSLL